MKNEEKLILENLVNEMLNNLFNSSLLEEIINILKDKISYY